MSLSVVWAPDVPGIQLALMLCVLLVSFAWQLWFLPWKAPLLNFVDAVSTGLFLILLAISLHLESADDDSLSFLDSLGTGVYFLSLGIIACASLLALVLMLWQRCSSKRQLIPSIVNLGVVREPADIIKTLMTVDTNLESKEDWEKEALLKKMSLSLSTYDLNLVGKALDILITDLELGKVCRSRIIVGRVADTRTLSQLSERDTERDTERSSTKDAADSASDLDRLDGRLDVVQDANSDGPEHDENHSHHDMSMERSRTCESDETCEHVF